MGLGMLLFSLVAQSALAFSDSGGSSPSSFPFVGEVAGKNVHLRAGFSKNYRSLRKLEIGEKVVVLDESQGWYKITVPRSYKCWVHQQFVTAGQEGMGTVSANAVNLRPTPSAYYFPVGQVDAGTPVTILSEKGDWFEIVAPPEIPAWVEKTMLKNVGTVEQMSLELARASETATRNYNAILTEKTRVAEERIEDIGLENELSAAMEAYSTLVTESSRIQAPLPLAPLQEIHGTLTRVSSAAHDPGLKQRATLHSQNVGRKLAYVEKLDQSRAILTDLKSGLTENESEYRLNVDKVKDPELDPPKAKGNDFETGWLEKGFDIRKAVPYYRLVKGGRVLALVASRKYDLKKFVNMKIAVRGEHKTAAGVEAKRSDILWIKNLEVIGGRQQPKGS